MNITHESLTQYADQLEKTAKAARALAGLVQDGVVTAQAVVGPFVGQVFGQGDKIPAGVKVLEEVDSDPDGTNSPYLHLSENAVQISWSSSPEFCGSMYRSLYPDCQAIASSTPTLVVREVWDA